MIEWSQEKKRIPLSETNFQKMVDFIYLIAPVKLKKAQRKKALKHTLKFQSEHLLCECRDGQVDT